MAAVCRRRAVPLRLALLKGRRGLAAKETELFLKLCGIRSRMPKHVMIIGAGMITYYLLRMMQDRKLNDLLFCGTGALFSPISSAQGESIPGICHAVWLSTKKE